MATVDRSFLSWPFFEERHRALAEEIDGVGRTEAASWNEFDEDDQGAVDATCRRIVQRLGQLGVLRHACAGTDAKAPLDVRSLCIIRETLARHVPLGDFAFAMQGLGSGPISLFGSAEQRARYLPRVSQGAAVAAFALSEPGAGSDVAAMQTVARRDDAHYVLDGEKTWISNGGIADFYVVFARTPDEGERAFGAFIVEAGTSGLSVAERIRSVAAHPLARLQFKKCRVAESARVGEAGKGLRVALGTLDVFRSTVGAAALGFARRALQEAVNHARARRLFDQPLSEFQLTQARLADMTLDIDASALLVYRAAWVRDTLADRVTREAAMAKLYATEAAQRTIDGAVQLLGALGVRHGGPVERLYREIRSLRIYEGTSEVQRLVIARELLAGGAEPASA
ncbi:MAG TPA: acyl-CoA dehydrogenase family protein [Gemmatimonadaceae bacterium]|jgi:alkylation response protein AidB-like acyl-CoA dehydrogenase|nr:acyl-CoA dehydrogenase family protein [Gemmatimonadaceae bacterium]